MTQVWTLADVQEIVEISDEIAPYVERWLARGEYGAAVAASYLYEVEAPGSELLMERFYGLSEEVHLKARRAALFWEDAVRSEIELYEAGDDVSYIVELWEELRLAAEFLHAEDMERSHHSWGHFWGAIPTDGTFKGPVEEWLQPLLSSPCTRVVLEGDEYVEETATRPWAG